MKRLLVDACFLIGLFAESDQYSASALRIYETYVEPGPGLLLLPWPIVFETISTKMSRNQNQMLNLTQRWKSLAARQRLQLVDDGPYRLDALNDAFEETGKDRVRYRSLSLADRVVRNMLADKQLRFDGFVTFNYGDFADVCGVHRREMIYPPR